jgi:glucose/mannose-6-phosphate isomerase
MQKLIEAFPEHLSEGLKIGKSAVLKKSETEIKNVLIEGLGGSGIAGTIIQNIYNQKTNVPIVVNKNYQTPGFVNESTLVITSSYSGNTEESIFATTEAIHKKATIACISSGGELKNIALANHLNFIEIPGGQPPRAMLGYSFVQQLFLLNHYGIIDRGFISEIENTVLLLKKETEKIKAEAKKVAQFLLDKIPIIYCDDSYEGVALRFRQQINENSKMLCWHHVIPEMNHNELLGWKNKREDVAVIFLRNISDFARNQKRMELNINIISEFCDNIHEIWSLGETDIERSLYFVHLCDWVSIYLADMQKIDATEIRVLNYLKGELLKFKS